MERKHSLADGQRYRRHVYLNTLVFTGRDVPGLDVGVCGPYLDQNLYLYSEVNKLEIHAAKYPWQIVRFKWWLHIQNAHN